MKTEVKTIKAYGLVCECGCDDIMLTQLDEDSPELLAIFPKKDVAKHIAEELGDKFKVYEVRITYKNESI